MLQKPQMATDQKSVAQRKINSRSITTAQTEFCGRSKRYVQRRSVAEQITQLSQFCT